jgi:hypothetical protein
MAYIKILFFTFLLAGTAGGEDNIIRIGDFSNCLKSSIPCGWEKFKDIKGMSLQQDSLFYFVTLKSVKNVEGIDRRLRFDANVHSWLKWRWRVHMLPAGACESVKKKNDSAAGIYLAFKGIYPFNHILKYVWSAEMPPGTMLPSPMHGKTIIFVVRSGSTQLNEWVTEKRDIKSDYIKAFGSQPPLVEGIAIQTDSDNTESMAIADYADICAEKE